MSDQRPSKERIHELIRLLSPPGLSIMDHQREQTFSLILSGAAIQDIAEILRAAVEPKTDWRCFHCGDVFTDEQSARDHFGPNQGSDPACAIDITEYRRMEEVNRGHCAEDTELHRALDAKSAEMMRAVRQAEEEGYNKGLQDGRASEPPSVVTTKHIDAALMALAWVDQYMSGGSIMLARQNLNIAISNLRGSHCETASGATVPPSVEVHENNDLPLEFVFDKVKELIFSKRQEFFRYLEKKLLFGRDTRIAWPDGMLHLSREEFNSALRHAEQSTGLTKGIAP